MALSYVLYTANGSTNQFDITFNYIAESHIKVYLNNVADSSFTFVNSSRIQTSTTPANGVIVKIDRDTPTDARLIDFQDGATILESDLDTSADQSFNIATENVDAIGDCLKLDNTGVYDAGSVRIINVATPTSGTDATNKTYIDTQTTSAATSATNAATSATAAATSATASATSATASATSATAATTAKTAAETAETNAETAETNAETAETNAETAETNAAASASTATTQASNASTSASTASTQATNAATSATAAASSASTASTQATNAATSATNAAASYDSFDDRYLGAKSSNPSLDNDGNALLDGATFFDATNNVFKVYDLGNTTWLQTIPSSSDQTNIDAAVANASNINSAVSNASNINSAVSNASNINSAVSNASNINSAVSNAANITTVAGISSNVTTCAGISSDITAVANISSDIADVQDKLSEIETAADDLNEATSEIDTVATAIANVDLVGGSIANVNLTGGSIANVNTVATNLSGVNSFAERYRVGSSDPSSSNDEGDLSYNSTSNNLKYFNGSSWVTIVAGSLTDIVQDGSPQLGGTLDVNGNAITSVSNGDISITPNGSGDVILDGLKYPQADGSANQFLKTDGSAQLSFATVDLTALSATNLTSGTIPDARFGALPAVSGANLTALNATNLGSGTVAEARLPASALGAVWESKSANFTAEARKNYFVDTTSNAVDVTLPSGTIGDEIHFLDVSGTFDTNDLTILYGSSKIQGASSNLDVAVERAGFTLVYYNSTQGWLLKDV